MSGNAPPPAGGQDQSMDDILASIRRILNEDEAAAQTAEAAEPAEQEAPTAEVTEVPAPEPPAPPRTPAPEFTPPPIAPPPATARSGPEPVELTPDMMVTPPVQAAPAPAPAPAPKVALTPEEAKGQCWMKYENDKKVKNIDARLKLVEKCVDDTLRGQLVQAPQR